MSFINDITAAIGIRQPATSSPALGTSALNERLGTHFQTTFSTTLADVYQRGASGEFDDPTLRLRETALQQQIQQAQASAGIGGPEATDTPTDTPAPSRGANAAPDATGAAPAQPAAPGSGSASTAAAADGASMLATTNQVALAQQRELHEVRIQQGKARLANLSASLTRDYPLAVALPSASTGWDPATFVPTTRAEAEAFAQRMVIDAAEAAARLDIVVSEREAARLDAATTGSAAAIARVTQLDEDYARQQAYVAKLAGIVDASSSGALTEAGAAALSGSSVRKELDVTAKEIADRMRAAGADEATVERVVGAGELAIEQADTPGGSTRLREAQQQTAEFTWTHRDNLNAARKREAHRIEMRRIEERREQDERRTEKRSIDKRMQAKREERREMIERTGEKNAQRRTMEFQEFLRSLERNSAA